MTSGSRCVIVLLVVLALFCIACTGPTSSGNAAIVNGVAIPMSAFDKQVSLVRESMAEAGLDPNSPDGQATLNQVREDILNQLIDNELLRQAAAQEGVTITEAQVEERVQQIIQDAGGEAAFKEALKRDKLTVEEFRALIVRNQLLYERLFDKVTASLPTSAEQVHVRHILLRTEAEALAVQARLLKGEDFAAVAKEVSLDSYTKNLGGDLGFLPRGAVDQAFEDAAFALNLNESRIVKTDFGYHVLQVLAREQNRPLPADYLQGLRDEAIAKYLDDLRSRATIEKLVKLPPSPTPSQ